MEKSNPIEEARRYVANAEAVIKKAEYNPETQSYMDSKYVKTAGDILWKGCLIALDAVLHVRKGRGRPSIEKYREVAGKRDRKLLQYLNNGYETLHLYMGYDGSKQKKVSDAGFEGARDIITHCAKLMPRTLHAAG